MAATVHFNTLDLLIRKIGFSVGLGKTYERVIELTGAYVEGGNLSYGTWTNLLQGWQLENEHIGDVFRRLDLLEVRQKRVFVLPGLDTLAICYLCLNDDVVFKAAAALIVANLILRSDADIFLNCLAAAYDKERVRELLIAMVRYKRERLFCVYKMPEMQKRIAHVVNIETQPTNAGGANVGVALSHQRPGLKRLSGGLERTADISEVAISDDYLRKVPVTRREWARSVGLFDPASGATDRGVDLLKEYGAVGFQAPNGAFAVWPLASEFAQLRLNPDTIGAPALSYWGFYCLAARAFGVAFRAA